MTRSVVDPKGKKMLMKLVAMRVIKPVTGESTRGKGGQLELEQRDD